MAGLTREQIAAARDGEVEAVSVAEWGDEPVYLRVMSAGERDHFEADILRRREVGKEDVGAIIDGVRTMLLARCLCDSEGVLLFDDDSLSILAEKSSVVVDRLNATAKRINKFDEKDVEELVGNSEGAPAGASTSDSASPSAPLRENLDPE